MRPWLRSPLFDGLWILSPPFFAVLLVALMHVFAPETLSRPLTPGLWLFAVVGVDVAHVYATVFRSYFRAELWRKQPQILISIPLLGFIASVLLYQQSPLWFWRVLAYLAVFHFVRQPYGLMRFYQRGEKPSLWDKLAIYAASIYPLVIWHLDESKTFAWFMSGDFLVYDSAALRPWAHGIALGIALRYAWQEVRSRSFNIPKNMIILGTALAFGTGIIVWNSDVAFTLTNVLSHGIPYMALIWIYNPPRLRLAALGFIAPCLFLGSLLCFAYIEEGFWDALVWADHPELFPWFARLGEPLSDAWLIWVVPLLALPQFTHYILDGFIWRLREQKT